jgi:hypothetical protein
MEKNTKILVGVVSVLAVGGLLYAFRGKLFPKKDAASAGNQKKEDQIVVDPTAPELTQEQKNAIVAANLALTNPLGALFLNTGASKQAYEVRTLGNNLNIRKTPSAKSEIVKKVVNKSTLYGNPSQVAGWHEVSEDGNKVIGYASSLYLVKK